MSPPPAIPRSSSLTIIAVILGIATITYLGPILTPLLIAVFLYFILRPAATGLVRRGVPAWLAYLFLFAVTGVAIIGLWRIVRTNAVEFQTRLPEYRENLLALLNDLPGDKLRAHVKETLAQTFDVSLQDVLGMAFGPAVSFLETALMVSFYLLFIMVSAGRMAARVRRALRPEAAERVIQIGSSISDGVAQYMRVKTLVSLGMAGCHAAILYFAGLHYWPLWGVLMFTLNYITYVGSIAALAPPILLAAVQFGSPWAAGGLAAVLIANRVLWIDYVEIRSSGKSLKVDPVLLLMSLAYWGWFWGAVGLVLAVPMLMGVKIALSQFENTRYLGQLISDD